MATNLSWTHYHRLVLIIYCIILFQNYLSFSTSLKYPKKKKYKYFQFDVSFNFTLNFQNYVNYYQKLVILSITLIFYSFQLQKVERFLHIPELFKPDQLIFNKHKGFYCFRRKDRYTAKCLGNTKGRPHINIMPEIQLKLRRSFRPYNTKFIKMVNQWWDWEEKSLS